MNKVKPTYSTLVTQIMIIGLLLGCSPSGSTNNNAHVGTYTTRQVNSMMGHEITTGKIVLNKDGTAECEVGVTGELHGIGVTPVDDHLTGSGSWELTNDDEIKISLKKVAFTRRGEQKQITSLPVIIELDTSLKTVSFGNIEWDRGEFVVVTVQSWNFMPAEK